MAEKRGLTHEERVKNFKNRLSGRKKAIRRNSAPKNWQKNSSASKQFREEK